MAVVNVEALAFLRRQQADSANPFLCYQHGVKLDLFYQKSLLALDLLARGLLLWRQPCFKVSYAFPRNRMKAVFAPNMKSIGAAPISDEFFNGFGQFAFAASFLNWFRLLGTLKCPLFSVFAFSYFAAWPAPYAPGFTWPVILLKFRDRFADFTSWALPEFYSHDPSLSRNVVALV